MNLLDFIRLSAGGKRALLLQEGILIAQRSTDKGPVFLFQVGSLYVEVYSNDNTRAIEEYVAFTDTAQLEPYLDSIAIDDLL
jgi:hypothetical protein